MVSLDIITDVDILLAIEDAAKKAPGLMKTVYSRAVSRLRGRVLKRLVVEAPPPRYPLRWKSARQRRYVMAKLRREGNLPYRRTRHLLASYDVIALPFGTNGAIIQVVNTDPKARFVVGDDAQPFHLDTRWVQMADVVSDTRVEAEDILIDSWFTVQDIFAGVPK